MLPAFSARFSFPSAASLALALAVLGIAFAKPVSAAVWIEGAVQGPSGAPLAEAEIALEGVSAKVKTDAQGRFALRSDAASGLVRLPNDLLARFDGPQVSLSGEALLNARVDLFDARGRGRSLDRALRRRGVSADLNLADPGLPGGPLASGLYVLRLSAEGKVRTVRFLLSDGRFNWPEGLVLGWGEGSAKPAGVSGRSARSQARGLRITKSGYQEAAYSVGADTALGIHLTLYPSGIAVPKAVTVTDSVETKTFRYQTGTLEGRYTWTGNFLVNSYHQRGYPTATKSKSFKVIHLDNSLIRISIAPELGMRILRVQDKTSGTVREMFGIMDNPANPNAHIHDIGGVKASYPYFEHGLPMIDFKGEFDAKAGYFIESLPDGAVQVVMSMRFDHFQKEEDMGYLGKFTDRPLSSTVTLRPGENFFTVNYVADNPNPTRRSNRLWNDAIFPREPHEVLFPAQWVSNHGATRIWNNQEKFRPNEKSQFALSGIQPFCGFYYPGANANHLRIADPVKNPGMKLFADSAKNATTPLEFWGSTNTLFENPTGFVGAFEPLELENRYYMARGIGKASYANEHFAVSVSGKNFKLVTTRPLLLSIFEFGTTNSPILDGQIAGPDKILSGTFANGIRIVSEGRELGQVKFPLEYAGSRARAVQDSLGARASGYSDDDVAGEYEKYGVGRQGKLLDGRWGSRYEIEGSQGKGSMMNSLASLYSAGVIASNPDAVKTPDSLLSIARAAYRHGGFAQVDSLLTLAGSVKPEEAKFLRALMAMEKGENADFSGTPPEGAYFRALIAIKNGQKASAIQELDGLISQRPNLGRPRILRAFLKGNIAEAVESARIVPGSIEAWASLAALGYPGASAKVEGLLQQGPLAKVRMDDFLKEAREGKWRHERRFEYQAGWANFSRPLPVFPENLKYK